MVKRLLLLNGIAILCVILFHATGWGFTAMFSWAHRYREVGSPNYDAVGTGAYYGLRLVEQFVVFCIPAFLFVSGYFVAFLAGRRATVGSAAIGARIKSLLIPYLFWSVITLVWLGLQGRTYSAAQYLYLVLTGSTSPHYYYVVLLVQLYVLAPVIVVLAKWRWKALLWTTAALQLVVYSLQYPVVLGMDIPGVTLVANVLPKWLFVAQLFWFTLGVVAGFQQPSLRVVLERTRTALLPCTVMLFVLGFLEWEMLLQWSGSPWVENRVTVIDGLYAGAAILSFLAFTDVAVPFAGALESLGIKSYGIYLTHALAMEGVSRGVYRFAPGILAQQALLQPLVIVVGLSVPLLLMALVNRSPARGLYPYLFG